MEQKKPRGPGKPFQKGAPGRPVGAKNKLPGTVKEMVLNVFNQLQDDPKANLFTWAQTETTEFYRIAAKLIPTEVKAKVEGTVNHFTIEPDAGCDPIQD